MTPVQKTAAGVGAILLATTGAVVVGVKLADKAIDQSRSVPAMPRGSVVVGWDKEQPHVTTEVWASTNLQDWTLRATVSGGSGVVLPADKPGEFFKVRNRVQIGTNTIFSDWARKPTL